VRGRGDVKMTENRCTSQVRERAYAIWEQDGRRHGNDWAHWFQAEAELLMYEKLWAGVGRKISNARSSLGEMGRSLQHDRRAEARASAASVPVGMPTGWEESFYTALDAFLMTARSVPEVINCCFGEDRSPQMFHLDRPHLQTLVYLVLSVVGHLTNS
jgi:hypothetical protein